MDAKALKALKASIRKWERNAKAKTPEEYLTKAGDCPLCDLFIDDGCRRCPVYQRSLSIHCMATPYVQASVARHQWAYSDGSAEAAHAAARAEVEFLKSLLPGSAS